MCFWHVNILIGVLRRDRHVTYRKHLNQDCARASVSNTLKIGLSKSITNLSKYPNAQHVSFVTQ
jgi:hypothetical protein